jgi:phosphoribosyl-AMP cyclohydrolase / phosphoribosyl-ATP pyrophosphohydrolase
VNTSFDPARIDFAKAGGLVPVVVQDSRTLAVLMLGYMNAEALKLTLETNRVTFYSRSRESLWVKGETSGHYLQVDSIHLDCDNDTLLALVRPDGPTCHTGAVNCFDLPLSQNFLFELEKVIEQRLADPDPTTSYTAKLAASGLARVAQKVGEEGVETVIAALAQSPEALTGEAADLLYHLTVLLKVKGLTLSDVVAKLQSRHTPTDPSAANQS